MVYTVYIHYIYICHLRNVHCVWGIVWGIAWNAKFSSQSWPPLSAFNVDSDGHHVPKTEH